MNRPEEAAPPPIRSALFTPAGTDRYLAAADRSGADAVILDLEDAVVDARRDAARRNARTWIEAHADATAPHAFVRVNAVAAGQLDDDLEAVVVPGLRAVLVPKVTGAEDVRLVSESLAWHEGRAGLPPGTVRIWPLFETAAAVAAAAAILAASPRIAYAGGATAAGGDLADELGVEVTDEHVETLYLRSHLLVLVRAARVPNPMTGMVTSIGDLDLVERFALEGRRLGYDGMVVIHPAHVSIVNRVFTPGPEEVEAALALLAAIETGRSAGAGSVVHDGRMVDAAMVGAARRVLHRARLDGGASADPTDGRAEGRAEGRANDD